MRRCMCYWNIDALADEFIQFCCMQVDARTGYMDLGVHRNENRGCICGD
jgi:hypothetical protein